MTVEELLRADDRRYDRIMASDAAALDTILTDDFTYTHNTGFIEGKADYLRRIVDGTVRYSDGERVRHDTRVRGATGIMTGHMRMKVHARDQVFRLDNLFLAAWVFEDDAWRLAAWASTAIKP